MKHLKIRVDSTGLLRSPSYCIVAVTDVGAVTNAIVQLLSDSGKLTISVEAVDEET